MAKRIAVIGAGPCGLSQLHAFEQARLQGVDIPEIVCFEKQSGWGGLWNFTWRTGLDKYGEPVHGSMYRYLWSNGPKECLEFADYTFDEHFGKPIPSFPPREVLYDYITGRAKKGNLERYIRFSTSVRYVEYIEAIDKFQVRSFDHLVDQELIEDFDSVIVCTGHFSVPSVPFFEGLDRFPGRVLHSHDFREAREFTGKDVLVVGSSYSAEDIALQSYKYGARSVTISYRTAPMGFDWPEGIKEVPLLTHIEGRTAHFKDGSTQAVDVIVLCVGYQHHFSFLADSLRLKTKNFLYPGSLYKGIFWESNPKLMYLGMQDQFYTFSMFDVQAWYARDVILGHIVLPDAAAMAEDIARWQQREETLKDAFEQIDFQKDYIVELADAVDYAPCDWDMTVSLFKEWEHDKEHSILGYRDKAFTSACTGTKAPVHHTPWIEAMDDSMADFLAERALT
ncbi:Flavin-binding monooxygenase-like subfamily [Synechococcus sp. PCC 7335]|uniref:NAD(P)-binding domain-containing protein n=1 Tax=Synechococcus sp. (strain ATCC 29403 / PCC 7335) TaxID=91464 RepID=UPI00017ED944|nr:NAD(P)/FAD-dependent oxidoreductase [Synechococcus sp. PCC 7335]EDX84076.1 Flavin-binding monooxygenase-like subfamily [Synechococcus sp. PCC 7335]